MLGNWNREKKMNLKNETKSITKELITWRRELHRCPETAHKEHKTAEFLKKALQEMGLEVSYAGGTGLKAVLNGRPGDAAAALRADMDALPIQEEGDKAYISQNPGAAHACAHDGHMAILLGAAKILQENKDQFAGKIVFIFQPAEELPPGGAGDMIKDGVLEGVEAVFGLHLWQPLPTGKVGIVPGPMMAAADNFRITITGRAGHGSMPHTALDPIFTAGQMISGLQSVVSRNLDPLKSLVVSFGTIQGGTVYNIIPQKVELTGTVRTFENPVREMARKKMKTIIKNTAAAYGMEAEFDYMEGYPPLVNNEAMTARVLQVVEAELGKDRITDIDPVMGGEDFAYYLQQIPGAFFFLGAGDGQEYPHHHPQFDFDESVLPEGVQLMCALTLDFLQEKAGAPPRGSAG
jgi:amidohydrolase